MSKNGKISILISLLFNGLIIALICLFIFIFLNIKQDKNFDLYKLKNHLENMGYRLIDVNDNYDGVSDYFVTDKIMCPYLISYTKFNDKEAANRFLNNALNDLDKNSGIKISTNIYAWDNGQYITSGDYYKVVIKNGDTILYASADKEYKEEIVNIFKDLDYFYKINLNVVVIAFILLISILILSLVILYKIIKKLTDKGYLAFIPFYNMIILYRNVMGSAWYLLLLFIPGVNLIMLLLFPFFLGRTFNKNLVYAFFMILFPTILIPLIAFDDSICINKI